MYKVSVPVILSRLEISGKEKILKHLKALDAERVFLAQGTYTKNKERFAETLSLLKENTAFFKSHGYEVGTWLWTFDFPEENDYVHMVSPSGAVDSTHICPSDESFVDFVCDYISQIAATGVELIMFDDDFRYGFLQGGIMGCTCKNHIAMTEKLLGEKLPEGIPLNKLFLSGEGNRFRTAWLKAKGASMASFSRRVREAVDKVDPSVRVGLCSCMSTWDQDGIGADEISKILAGSTKPFLRLIGAPYWGARRAFGGTRLQYTIEYERMERSWCEDGIEIFAEGDTYTRPRYACPASFLEGFDTALRADGSLDGILKYAIDYTSTADYETGYVDRHVKNKPLYRQIDEIFVPKTPVGVRVWEVKNKFEHTRVPEAADGQDKVQHMFFSSAAKLLSTLSVPTVYSGRGVCGAAFGENAKYVPQQALDGGMILDLRAAEILINKGVDVGLVSIDGKASVSQEYYINQGEYISPNDSVIKKVTVRDSALIDSVYMGDSEIPAAWKYENADGQRFFVFNFEADFNSEWLWRHYTKAKQLAEAVEWVSGKKLPAHITGAPDAYLMAKQSDEGALAVGIWNFHPDDIPVPKITLGERYTDIRFINCTGELCGDTVTLSRIEPYGFAGFEVK